MGCDDEVAIAVHVVVSHAESGQTETAWAKGNHAFDSDSTGNSRWGWWADYEAQCGCGGVDSGSNSTTNSGNVDQCCACPASSDAKLSGSTCAPHVTKVFGGQTLYALDLAMTNTADSITIAVSAQPNWSFGMVHIYMGPGPIRSTPQGTPIPGQFPYQLGFDTNVATWSNTWTFDELSSLFGFTPACGGSFYVLVHFELHGPSDETGWAFGSIPFSDFGSPRWGWAMNYTMCCASKPPSDDEGCTFTQGYWKNHNAVATRPSQKIDWPITESTELCGKTWLSILKTPVKGDKWFILAHQWIAAKLNVANGAAIAAISAELQEAQTLLEKCTLTEQSDKQLAMELADKLDDYNNGVIGPGHCDESTVPTDICECRCPVSESSSKPLGSLPRFTLDDKEPLQVVAVAMQHQGKVKFTLNAESGSPRVTITNPVTKQKTECSSGKPSVELDADAASFYYVSSSGGADTAKRGTSAASGSVSVEYQTTASRVQSGAVSFSRVPFGLILISTVVCSVALLL
jgi:hypothetical protein